MLDFFAGSGTTGMAAHVLGRDFILVDDNPEALEVMAKRFGSVPGVRWEGFAPQRSADEDVLGASPRCTELSRVA